MLDLSNEILEVVDKLSIKYMPTRIDLETNGFSPLVSKIGRNGGFAYWRERLNLEKKATRISWNEEMIKEQILEVSKNLFNGLYMPSSVDIIEFNGDHKLHNKIAKGLGYRGWAEKLSLKNKYSDTNIGIDYENVAMAKLLELGYSVENTSSGFPFDILVDGSVSIDVKCGTAYYNRGSRAHTFGINKEIPTSDLYMIFALDESGKNTERVFIIPSHVLKMKTLNIGAKSKYNKYIDRYDLLDSYIEFKRNIIKE